MSQLTKTSWEYVVVGQTSFCVSLTADQCLSSSFPARRGGGWIRGVPGRDAGAPYASNAHARPSPSPSNPHHPNPKLKQNWLWIDNFL